MGKGMEGTGGKGRVLKGRGGEGKRGKLTLFLY